VADGATLGVAMSFGAPKVVYIHGLIGLDRLIRPIREVLALPRGDWPIREVLALPRGDYFA
jgi:hypothetical protein